MIGVYLPSHLLGVGCLNPWHAVYLSVVGGTDCCIIEVIGALSAAAIIEYNLFINLTLVYISGFEVYE